MARLKPLAGKTFAGLPAWWYGAFLILAGATFHEGDAWFEERRIARQLADPSALSVDEDSPPALRLAKAYDLARSGQIQESIRLYHTLLKLEDEGAREVVHYNLATLYLRDGAKLWNAVGVLEYARVNTLVELAKEHFREALRLNPERWDARFNLEYAWRITPPPKERAKSDWKGSKSSVFSTLPGLPGGGP